FVDSRKLPRHELRATVEVGLVNGDNPASTNDRASRLQSGLDVGGVASVVVIHTHAANVAVELEPSPDSDEALKAAKRLLRVETEPDQHGEGPSGVDRVVPPRHGQLGSE